MNVPLVENNDSRSWSSSPLHYLGDERDGASVYRHARPFFCAESILVDSFHTLKWQRCMNHPGGSVTWY